jgi:hypothetical protein
MENLKDEIESHNLKVLTRTKFGMIQALEADDKRKVSAKIKAPYEGSPTAGSKDKDKGKGGGTSFKKPIHITDDIDDSDSQYTYSFMSFNEGERPEKKKRKRDE